MPSLLDLPRGLAALSLVAVVDAVGGTPPTPGTEPIWVASWGEPKPTTSNIVPMVRLPGSFTPLADNASLDVDAVARELRRLPKGRRALLALRYCPSFWGIRGDAIEMPGSRPVLAPWAARAMSEIEREWPRTLALLKHCGADLDLLVFDLEESGRMTTWWLEPEHIDALRADPRWRLPFAGVEPLADSLKELEGMPAAEIKKAGDGRPYLRWNLAMGRLTAQVMSRALWDPAESTFPGAIGANFNGQRVLDRPAPDGNGHLQPNDSMVGNGASPVLYGYVESIVNLFIDPADPTRIAWKGSVHPPRTPWFAFLLCSQQVRACARGAPDAPILPWIANPSYPGDEPQKPVVPFPNDLRCYDETIRHAALAGVPTFLWWRSNSMSTDAETDRLDALVSDINQHTLGRVKEPADVEPISFLAEVVVSGGRRHDGKWVWRVSASPEVALLREVGTGREWAPTADSLGFWVETAEKVAPKWEVARRRDPTEPSLARPVTPAPPP